MAIVAEKTGYPAEMLEPAMRLDADLGIDSIKRVEILSALQEQLPDAACHQTRAPRRPPGRLADIVDFLDRGGCRGARPLSPTTQATASTTRREGE